jgi:hypothetical protein
MRETQEVEGLWLPRATRLSVCHRVAAKLDESRLVGVQRQAELRESVA